ncbi:hypothetical protein GOBAR_DD03263 [Gossypium barbadense]|nr:hypothetical protein GOBAR_DD03263 [Gossypium barbadense]
MQRRFANPFQKKGSPNRSSFTLSSLSQAVITEIDLHPPSPSQHRQKLPANQSSIWSQLPSLHISPTPRSQIFGGFEAASE